MAKKLYSFLILLLGTTAAKVLVPTTVITLYALVSRDDQAIAAFAIQVAEPLALFGAAAFAAAAARKQPKAWDNYLGWLGLTALITAGSFVSTDFILSDANNWTVAATILLPCVVWLARRRRTPINTLQAD
jgi:peptidoglycan/LPS O-acetylase OafA/YrhL